MIRVVIADDHPLFRRGLREAIAVSDHARVVGEAHDHSSAVEVVRDLEPDTLLLDACMPGAGLIHTLTEVRSESPRTRTVVLSDHAEEQLGMRAFRLGAMGYLEKACTEAQVLEAIVTAGSGRRFVPPHLAHHLAGTVAGRSGRCRHESLSDREYEVFLRLIDGCDNTAIAEELEISPKTVSTYRRRILVKMRVSSVAELVRYAFEYKLASLPNL